MNVIYDASLSPIKDFRITHNNERHAGGAYEKYFIHFLKVGEELIKIISVNCREDAPLDSNYQLSDRSHAMLLDINGKRGAPGFQLSNTKHT